MINKSGGFILMAIGKAETLIMVGNLQLGTIINIITVTWELKIDGLPDFQ